MIYTELAAVVLAAGKSTRMKSVLPKAAHPICGKPMTRHIIDACRAAGVQDIVVVAGHEAEMVKQSLGDDVAYALQAEQLGTGHAARIGLEALPDHNGLLLILPGDAPLITDNALRSLIETHEREGNSATLLTAMLTDAGSYGRVVRGQDDSVERIVEAKDADAGVLAIHEINASIYAFDSKALREKLNLVKPNNAQSEYYLTDVIAYLVAANLRVGAVVSSMPDEVLGINTRVELAEAAELMRRRILCKLMLSGVTLTDPLTTYIDCDVEIGQDSVVMPCTIIERGCRIGKNCKVGPFVRVTNSTIGDNVTVQFANVADKQLNA